jgi:hypothetical protein
MTIKPVLVPDHDAASLRKLMDHFATASTGPTKQQLNESRAAVTAAQDITEARNTYTVVFVDPSDAPKQIGTFDNAAEAKQLIKNSYREMYDTGDHLRNVAPGIYALEEDYRNTGEQATADNYKHMYHWIIQKSSGVTEGSISDLLNQDPTSPKFNDHPGASQLKKAKDQPKPYPALKNTRTGKVRPHPNDPDPGVTESSPRDLDHMPGKTIKHQNTNCTTCHGSKSMYKLDGKLFADNKKGAVRVKCPACKGTGDKPGVTEGFMDTVKQAFNDCVVGYPQGTSEGQFIQGWARAIRAETGRDIPLEKLTKLYHDYAERSDEIMQSHGTTNEGVSETAAWRRKEGKSKTGGLNKKGVASYRRENPGSKLQTAVTTKPSKLKKGSKASKRRKSFCARMGGVKGPMKKPNGKPTRKALALRKWNCESVEQLQSMLMIAESWARKHEGK